MMQKIRRKTIGMFLRISVKKKKKKNNWPAMEKMKKKKNWPAMELKKKNEESVGDGEEEEKEE